MFLNQEKNSDLITFVQTSRTIAFHNLAVNLKISETYKMMAKFKLVDVVKWLASVIQLVGYGMTGLNLIT